MNKKQYERMVMKKHGFKSRKGLYDFLLACYGKAATRSITITNIDGKKVTYLPTEKSLNLEEDESL